MATLPPEGITPISPEGAVQEPLIKQAAPVVASKTPANYTVKKGDCLWFIAGKVYGNPLKWPKIYKANKGKIKNPDRIDPGQVLEIPPL
jgi:nucleoid-associated protein YgaU